MNEGEHKMRLLGLLGGMSWESTAYYYDELNRGVRDRLGELHSMPCIIHSVDFSEIESMQKNGRWEAAGEYLAERARGLESAGAEGLLLCTNTMHRVMPAIQSAIDIPALHIADSTGDALKRDSVSTVALLGTRFTMEQRFYIERIEARGIEVLVPNKSERDIVHEVIYSELCLGKVYESSREKYVSVINSLRDRGAQAVILGCTEIGLLIKPEHSSLPVYDTTLIHVHSALDWSLASVL